MANGEGKKKSSSEKRINYSFKIHENVYKRLEKIVYLQTFLSQKNQSKQTWILDAISAKLKIAENLPSEIPKERQIQVRINDTLNEILEEKVDKIRQFKNTYSKKQWVLEAIIDKLEKDEMDNKLMLEKIPQDLSS